MSLLPKEGKAGHLILPEGHTRMQVLPRTARVPPACGTAPAAAPEVQFPAQTQEHGKAAIFVPQGCGEGAAAFPSLQLAHPPPPP